VYPLPIPGIPAVAPQRGTGETVRVEVPPKVGQPPPGLTQQPIVEGARPQPIAALHGLETHQGGGVPRAQAPGSQETQQHPPVIFAFPQEDLEIPVVRVPEQPTEGAAWLAERHFEVADEKQIRSRESIHC
jgi:hypothetical protein